MSRADIAGIGGFEGRRLLAMKEPSGVYDPAYGILVFIGMK